MTLQHKQGWYTPAWQPIYLTIHFHRISLKMKSSTFPSVYLAVPSGWGAPILLFPAQQHPCRHQAQLLVGPYGDASAPLCMLMAFATQAHSKHWSDFLSLVPEYSKNTKPQIKELNKLSAWFRSIQNLRAAFCALRHSLTFNSNCERKKKMLWQPHCNLTTLTENPVGWTATVYYITHCLSSLSLAVITEDKSGCENGFLSGGNLMINVTKCLLSYDLSLMAG